MTTHRCDVMYSLPLRDLQTLGIEDHDAGEKAYKVTEPGTFKASIRYFCSLAHLVLWAQKVAQRV